MKRRKSIVFKVVALTMFITVMLLTFVSIYEINSFADRAALYLENKLLTEKLRVQKKVEELIRLADKVSSSVIENFSKGMAAGEYENVKRIEISPEGAEGKDDGGFNITRKFMFHDVLYNMRIYVNPRIMEEIVKDREGKIRLIVVDYNGKVVLPDELAGKTISTKEIEIKGLVLGRLIEILKKYDINLAVVNGERFYVMDFKSPLFSGYKVYVVIDYEETLSKVKRFLFGALTLDGAVVFSIGLLLFFYIRGLTMPVERIIDELMKRKMEGSYEPIDVEVKSEEIQDMLNIVNELIVSAKKSLEEAAKREEELRKLHDFVSRSRNNLMKLNEIINDLMMVKSKKSVLEIASTEAARIFEEIDTICYEFEGELDSDKGGKCGDGIPLIITVPTSEAEYRFYLYGNIPEVEEHIRMLDIYFSITAAIAENKDLWEQIEDSYFYLTQKLSEVSEVYDDETGKHIKRVGEYCAVVASGLGMDKNYVEKIRMFSQLHDIGKLKVPMEILTKPEKLTEEEFEIMKRHTIYGAEFLGEQPWLRMARNIALYHHENWDGSGYPFGLKGEEIPLEARIVKIADVYDALRSPRRYKPALDHKTVVKIILEGDGRTMPQHFDPDILEVFKNLHLKFNEIFEINRD